MNRVCAWALGLFASLLLTATAWPAASPRTVSVAAAASLTDVLQSLGDEYTRRTGVVVKLSFAASSVLAHQIEAGSGADLFVSADTAWMDYLEQRALIREPSRHDLLGNRLVLVAPAQSQVALRIGPKFPLRAALGAERLATGDPDFVPAGRYAKKALTSLGVWEQVADRLVRAENVRAALVFVAHGDVPLGIVYETDARIDPKVRIVDTFPEATHSPIRYPAALTKTAGADAASFFEFLRGPDGRAAFERFGFRALP